MLLFSVVKSPAFSFQSKYAYTGVVMRYEIDVVDWWQFEDTGIPDSAWQSHGPGDVYQSTVIEITDFDWAIKFRETRPEYLLPV
jgi:hypothetical protein